MKIALVTFCLALLAGCAAAGPAPARAATPAAGPALPAGPGNVDIPFEKHILPNGLTLILHEDHKAPIVAVNVWYHVGSKDEKPGKTGFAHLFEHLMFQGSENYKDEYFKPFEQVGATDMNGTTWLDRTNYFENVPTTALDLALWMESDRMGHFSGAIDQKLLDEQRGVVQNEKREGENEPYGKVWEALQRASFPEGHPYRWETIGSMADLNAASLADVKEWFRTHYGAANVTLVIAGDIDPKATHEKVLQYFGDIPAGPPIARRQSWIAPRSEPTRETMQDRVAQVRIYKAWNAPPVYSRDADQLALALRILGGSKTSRLYERLVYREQIADTISADISQFELASMVTIDADVKRGVDPARVELAIAEELERFFARGPTAEEVQRSQTVFDSAFLRGLERIGGFGGKADTLAESQVYAGDPAAWQRSRATILGATPAELQAVAARWLRQGDHTLTVVPFPEYTTGPGLAGRSKGVPAVSKFPDLVFPPLQRGKLGNGIEVVLAERHDLPLVGVQALFDAGYAADVGVKLGTSNFTMGMLDEGTRSLKALEITARVEALGAQLGAGANLDACFVNLSALKPRLRESLALYADVIRNPAFDESEFKRVQSQWLAGIAQEKTEPLSLALRTTPPLLYGEGHAYAIPFTGSGTEASIGALTPADLRRFHEQWLRPDNLKLLVVGDVTMAEAIPLLEEAFGNWRATGTPPPAKNIAGVELPPKSRVYLIDKPEAEQSVIIGGLLSPSSRDPQHLEIQTMNAVLGGTFTSRLNMNLREDKHWAYGAFSFMPGALGQRPYLVYAPVQTDKTVESTQEILKELRNYAGREPARADEIAKIKAKDVRSLPGKFETSSAVLGALSGIVLYQRPDDYVQTLKARTEAQQDSDIRAAASAIVKPDRITWVIVGDLAKIEAPIRKLNLGEVKILDADGNVVR